MIRLLIRLSVLVLLAAAVAWLADRPGSVRVDWMGNEIETSLAAAAAVLAIAFLIFHSALRLLRRLFRVPGEASDFFRLRRHRRGYEALSKGYLAIGSGDLSLARRHAETARRVLPDEPLTGLLEVQAAQAAGDGARVKALLTGMAEDPRTAIMALRGLHAQAQARGDFAEARQLAGRALAANPALGWAGKAMMLAHSAAGEWDEVLRILEAQRRGGTLSPAEASAKRAVVLTAQAQAIGARDPKAAQGLALSALKLDPGLVPAALCLARLSGQTGEWKKAQKHVARAFQLSPHHELAEAYARLQPSASPAERLKRLEQLLAEHEGGEEGAVALARTALAAREFGQARKALAPWIAKPRQRVASLMAAIAECEGSEGAAREWLSRALVAERDPQWTADGHVSQNWLPTSPVSGELGVFQWKVPVFHIGEAPAPPPAAPLPPTEALRPLPAETALPHLPDDPGTEAGPDNPEAELLGPETLQSRG